jgi:hypothetical protein
MDRQLSLLQNRHVQRQHQPLWKRHVQALQSASEAESKEKHGVWDPMPEMTITSPYVRSTVDSNTFTMDNPTPRVDFIPQSGTLDLASEQIRPEAAQAAVEIHVQAAHSLLQNKGT